MHLQGQLKLLIQSPQEPVFAMISAAYEIASVGAAVTMGLSDILANSADPENGTSIEEVAVQTKSNPPKLGGCCLTSWITELLMTG